MEDFCAIIEKGGPATDLEARIVGIEYSGNCCAANRMRTRVNQDEKVSPDA
jgi:hypothetical protein